VSRGSGTTTRSRVGGVNWVALGIVVVLAVAAVVALAGGPRGDGRLAGGIPVDERVAVPVPLEASAVTGLDVPGIGLFSREVTELGLRDDDSLDVPTDARTVGWYERSASPGAVGPAVLAAHVDYKGEEGVFARLGDVRAGDRVEVYREDDTVAVFAVDRVDRFAKDAFPTEAVYGPTPDGQIRLITCGGVFNEEKRSYDDNIVVFGHLESAYRAA
jgi:hypothetical protein